MSDIFIEIGGVAMTEEDYEQYLDSYFESMAKEIIDYIDSGDWFMDSDRRKDDVDSNT